MPSIRTLAQAGAAMLMLGGPAHAEICSDVARLAEQDRLDGLRIDADSIGEAEAHRYFPDAEVFHRPRLYVRADVNADGADEHLAILMEGSARIDRVLVREDRPGAPTFTTSAYMDGGNDMALLRIDGVVFALGGTPTAPVALWGFDADARPTRRCDFSVGYSRELTLAEGKGIAVCEARAANGWQPVAYTQPHSIDLSVESGSRFWSKRPGERVARVDIDNDGQLDDIVEVHFDHGGGRGCSTRYLAATDAARTTLPQGGVNRVLEELWGYPCGPALEAFEFAGAAYLNISAEPWERVRQIRGEEVADVCEFVRDKRVTPRRPNGPERGRASRRSVHTQHRHPAEVIADDDRNAAEQAVREP